MKFTLTIIIYQLHRWVFKNVYVHPEDIDYTYYNIPNWKRKIALATYKFLCRKNPYWRGWVHELRDELRSTKYWADNRELFKNKG